MKIMAVRIKPNIIHLKFKKQVDMTSSLIRFQEFFESPKFKDKVFTLDKIKSWYKKHNKGKFTYYTDWTGFNFPSTVVDTFRSGKFNPLRKKERRILDILKGNKGVFYVIGTYNSDDLRHEMAHALYYVDSKYRAEVSRVIDSLSKKCENKLNKFLKDDYNRSTWEDERHAYLLEDSDYIEKKIGLKSSMYNKPRKELIKIFKKYA